MAVLTAPAVTNRLPVGDLVMQTFQTSATTHTGTDEWVATGLSWIIAVVGVVVLGTAGDSKTPFVVLNASGTAATAGDNPGNVGITVTDAGTNTVQVTVLGRP